ncbi:hypothetical protein U9M48_005301 [Paspalum notatum var. saurae]|uniref:Reverse transcriptase Ty1/copia-type domain-containing protein n=1 Tax=Paspalum notatum var. saurae TaxID=547442 RepID=A0AAQ3PPV6_PASNO
MFSAPLIILFVPFFSKPTSLPHIGLRPSTPPPTSTLQFSTPYHALFGRSPTYDHLRVFGCRCYPNISSTSPHKLAPRSVLCVFLGYSSNHKGYRCLDIATNRVIISRHVVFDESSFPFAEATSPSALPTNLDFLDDHFSQVSTAPAAPPGQRRPPSKLPPALELAGTPGGPAASPLSPHGLASPLTSPGGPAISSSPGGLASPLASPGASVASSSAGGLASPLASAGGPAASSSPGGLASSSSPGGSRGGPTITAGPSLPGGAGRLGGLPLAPGNSPGGSWHWTVPSDVHRGRSACLPRVPSAPTPLPAGAIPVPNVINTHGMRTRAKDGFRQPRLNLQAVAVSPVPTSYRGGLDDPHWRRAMEDEFQALVANNTWTLVPRPPQANVVTGKWIFKHKLHSDGSLDRYKACWVLRGFTQRPGVDYDETFSPVVKPATIRTVLSLAISYDWHVHQLDVNNAFLHGTLTETVYCSQPTGFIDSSCPDHVCRLNKSLYGLKQAPRAWYSCFAAHLRSLGFVEAKTDTSLFVYRHGDELAFLLLYVDDVILTASTSSLLHRLIISLQAAFPMKDLGPLQHFLGIGVTRSPTGMVLSQRQYLLDILDRAGMSGCKPCTTLVDTQAKLSASGTPVADVTAYRSLVGALQYLTFTRPDITYAVQQVCLHMHDPREPHMSAVKRILRYLRGTADLGLSIGCSTTSSLTVYTDADSAGCPDTWKSTSGYAVFLGDNLISWSSKRQPTVSRSSAEAEYRAVANGVAEASWLRQLLQELHQPLRSTTLVYCDNVSAVYLSTNPVQHQRTKHIEIDPHFVRERVAAGAVRVLHVPTTSQFADLFTKGLPTAIFQEFHSSMNVRSPDAPAAGGC